MAVSVSIIARGSSIHPLAPRRLQHRVFAAHMVGRVSLGERSQVHQQLIHVLVAVLGGLGQGLVQDTVQFDRHAGTQGRHRLGLHVENAVGDRRLRFSRKRQAAADHLVENHSQRPDVAALIRVLALNLLG